jgi:protein-disulfide isomerase
LERYVEDGALRIEWRDFPYLGQESVNAAQAARAAQEQGHFWDYHDLLYENQKSTNSGAFFDDRLLDLAREAGLDVEQFEAGYKGGEYEAVVNEDFREAQDVGIQGTPSFTINEQRLVGPQPLEAFEQIPREGSHTLTMFRHHIGRIRGVLPLV